MLAQAAASTIERAPAARLRLALAAAAIAATGAGAAASGAAPAPVFDPITFFTGVTVSTGTLKQVFAAAKASRVTGFGALRGPGTFVLDQTVAIAGEPVRKRQWQLHQLSPGHFGGTLSDAASPVTIDVAGNRLLIKYTMNGGLGVTSVLTIAPDGRSGRNESRIKKWGMGVATLSEVIQKQ